ncbi:protein sorting system archaetidylserine synthase [Halomarina ordinaria]|uniref:Protein sorting system archaetidylserine synthase n=1 Tax=Halomarina ordinaria TaxID=3033939 RepID=A0ABD5U6I0_9EURY|nr:protein sorting system archaetidylserine synthase [Halomarina sp. PSRA2]
MRPRFVGRLGVADCVTVTNAALGFAAAAAVLVDPGLAARLILLAAVADGLDGVLARVTGGTPVGEYLDSLADVASFGVAPALFVFGVTVDAWGAAPTPRTALAVAVPALFVGMAVVRLGLYTAYDVDSDATRGVQTTLAGTVLAVLYLAGLRDPWALLVVTGALAGLMVTRIPYPDLYARDALAMGVVQVLAIVAPEALSRAFPKLLLGAALGYLLLAPRFYWRTPRFE